MSAARGHHLNGGRTCRVAVRAPAPVLAEARRLRRCAALCDYGLVRVEHRDVVLRHNRVRPVVERLDAAVLRRRADVRRRVREGELRLAARRGRVRDELRSDGRQLARVVGRGRVLWRVGGGGGGIGVALLESPPPPPIDSRPGHVLFIMGPSCMPTLKRMRSRSRGMPEGEWSCKRGAAQGSETQRRQEAVRWQAASPPSLTQKSRQ